MRGDGLLSKARENVRRKGQVSVEVLLAVYSSVVENFGVESVLAANKICGDTNRVGPRRNAVISRDNAISGRAAAGRALSVYSQRLVERRVEY